MKLIKPSFEILSEIAGDEILKKWYLEKANELNRLMRTGKEQPIKFQPNQ